MDIIEALRSRRSIGRVGGDVDDKLVDELIELGTWAPNHHLTEPWRFTVLRGDARKRLGELWSKILSGETALTGTERDEFLRKQAEKTVRAPVIIAVSVRTDDDPVVAAEDFAAAAVAVQNILLGAHAKGLGAAWRTGGMAYHGDVKAFLGLDSSDRIVAFVYLGIPAAEAPKPRPRQRDDVVRRLE